MSLPFPLARLLAPVVVVAALLVPLTVTSQAAAPAPRAGSGIGDRYFPLDGNAGIDVVRYDVDVAYDFRSARLSGRTTLTVKAKRTLRRFNLDLLLPVREVRINGRVVRHSKPHPHELRIRPQRPIAAGRTFRVTVRYAGNPGKYSYAGERNWLADSREVVTMNQPHMAPWWFPANDHPRDKALMDVSVTVPRGKSVIGNGHQVSRRVHGRTATTRWRAREPMAPYLAFFAAGDFTVSRGTYGTLPWVSAVSKHLSRTQQRESMRLMRRHGEITAWAEKILGRYPFSTTGGVTTALPVGFALENQTRPTYPYLGATGVDTVVHEVAHQWLGNSVSVRNWRDIWLNEGAATFMEVRWNESDGKQSGRDWLDGMYESLADHDWFWDLQIDNPGPRRIFDEPIYLRGGMTFQALRQRLGSATFDTVLRTWVRSRARGNGSTADFVRLAERISGEDLDGFFQAWLRDPRRPARTAANGF